MVHARISEVFIHFTLMYTANHILPVLPIQDLINKYGELTMPFELSKGMKPSISSLCVLFCPCVVRKSTVHVGIKALNMCHQSQKGFCSIFVGIQQHQKGYLVHVQHRRKIFYSFDDVFDESLSSALVHM